MSRSSGRGRGSQTQTKAAKDPPKHGEEGYDPLKDPRNIGFQLGSYGGMNSSWLCSKLGKKSRTEIDAYDFYRDPKTGIRPIEVTIPFGGMFENLEQFGVDDKTVLPPVAIWRQGGYLSDLLKLEEFRKPGPLGMDALPFTVKGKIEDGDVIAELLSSGEIPDEIWNLYVVSGEGTPGNNVWRVYALPAEIASNKPPKHPLMWKKELKKGTKTSYSSYGLGSKALGSGPGFGVKKQEDKPAKVSSPGLPMGVRIRCGGCGHWFKMDDLSAHGTVCAGMTGSEEADWALMCDPACGCKTLDEASKPKDGFPRKKKEEPKAEEDSPNGDGGGAAVEPHAELVVPAAI